MSKKSNEWMITITPDDKVSIFAWKTTFRDRYHVNLAKRMFGFLPAGLYKFSLEKRNFGLTNVYRYRQIL